ncbi:hypothetical protein WJX74_006123 [Apatococcus lobatus]|uniref:Uncharacterized protein n=1 Tax=Apatococcus lobatus TaxID=904363 RepID=A0AAW1S281_9CHLO
MRFARLVRWSVAPVAAGLSLAGLGSFVWSREHQEVRSKLSAFQSQLRLVNLDPQSLEPQRGPLHLPQELYHNTFSPVVCCVQPLE